MFKIEDAPRELSFGRQGETGVMEYAFDFSDWATDYPGGTPSVDVILPYTEAVVTLGAAQAVVDGTTLAVKVQSNLTAAAGRGTMLVRYTAEGLEKRSRLMDFVVEKSHSPAAAE